jgi:hypothetical protein
MSRNNKPEIISILILTEDKVAAKEFFQLQKNKLKSECEQLNNSISVKVDHYDQNLSETVERVINKSYDTKKYNYIFLIFDTDTINSINVQDTRGNNKKWSEAQVKIVNHNQNKRDDDAIIEVVAIAPCFEWGILQLLQFPQSTPQCNNKSESKGNLNKIGSELFVKEYIYHDDPIKVWNNINFCSYDWKKLRQHNIAAKDSNNNYSEFYKLFEIL